MRRFRVLVPLPDLMAAAMKELATDREVMKAFVLAALGGLRRQEMDALTWANVRLALMDLYKNDFPEGFLLVDATLATEEWMAVLSRPMAYGTWIFCTVAMTDIADEQEDETVELASTLVQ